MENEKIVGIVDDLTENNFWKNKYNYWLAFITDRKTIIFVNTSQTGGASFASHGYSTGADEIATQYKISKMKKSMMGKGMEEIKKIPNLKIIFYKNDFSGINLENKRIKFKIDNQEINIKTNGKHFNIIKGIVKENLSYEFANKKSGINYKRLFFWISFILIMLIFAYLLVYKFP